MSDDVKQAVQNLKDQLVAWRRDFHAHPELGHQETRTAGIVAGHLKDLGLEVRTGVGRTGVVGLLRGKRPGRTVMLRADMDALPIQETGEAPYCSQNPGVMHACGHDGHTAILMGVARILCGLDLPGNVKFVFQPAEETFAGAAPMIEEGVMEDPKVDAAFGLHIINPIPTGMVGVTAGPLMAGADWFGIKIKGRGSHGANPNEGVDAIVAAAQVVTALQTLISKEISPTSPLVVHVGKIQGGEAFNIVAQTVEMEGTVRTLDDLVQQSMPERMERIIGGVTRAMRAEHELLYIPGCPPVVNDPAMADLVRAEAVRVVGQDLVFTMPPVMGAEDMALYLKKAPGCFFFVGGYNPEKGLDGPHHNSRFDFDETALIIGAEILVRTARAYLEAPA